MLSKLRYLTQQSTARGTQNFLNKASTDFNNLTKVCFHCDSIHIRKTANVSDSEPQSRSENDDVSSQTESCPNDTVEFTFKALLEEANTLKDNTRKHYDSSWSRNFPGSKVDQNPISYSKILEKHVVTSGMQKRDLSTSRWLPNQKTPTRRSHTDTSMGWIAGRDSKYVG